MEVSFAKNPEVDTATRVVEIGVAEPAAPTAVGAGAPHPQATLVPTAPNSVAVYQSQAIGSPGGLVLGDKLPEFKDIILPRLNIVQGTGQLKDSFPQGALVFGQALILHTPPVINGKTQVVEKPATPPVTITVLGFRPTRFAEKVASATPGMVVDTEDQVKSAGGTLDYKEWESKKADGMLLFQPLADAVVVIERPECAADDDTVFIYSCDGKKYALALWAMKGTSYTAAAKGVFFTQRAVGCLRGGYPTWNYSVSTRIKTGKGNSWYVPVCIPKAKSTPAFMEFAVSILSQP